MKIIITLLICLYAAVVIAQTDTEKTEPVRVRPFQMSLLTPIGTNGIESHLIANKVSINILGGYSYGNYYFELGGYFNVNFNFTRGLQIASLFNWSGNTENAIQLAGLFNVSLDGNAVAQISMANIAKESTFQFGLVNLAAGNAGVQIGGFGNIAKDSIFQLGLANLSTGNAGVQISGLGNIAQDSIFQLGMANLSAGNVGVQISGLGNIAQDSIFQFGLVNLSAGTTGTQLGLINIAKELNGLQFGLINYVEDANGVPIGFFTFVLNGGKREFEVGFSESLNTFASYKSGVDKFYNITSIGIHYIDKPILYGVGFGVGSQIDWTREWGSQIELVFHDMFVENLPSLFNLLLGNYDANFLAQFKIKASRQFNEHFKVFFGPVLNFIVSRHENPDTKKISPWSMWKRETDETSFNSWIGFEAGVSVSL
jgi:hypothetical protein